MNKLITAVVVAIIMSATTVPAKAVEPLGFAVFSLILIGPHVAGDLVRAGKLPGPPTASACKVENVKAENGNYVYRRVIDDGKGCIVNG